MLVYLICDWKRVLLTLLKLSSHFEYFFFAFGSEVLNVMLKITFLNSLELSALHFKVHHEQFPENQHDLVIWETG